MNKIDVNELLPPIGMMQGMIEIAVILLEDKNYWYSFHRLRIIENEYFRLYCLANEDVVIP